MAFNGAINGLGPKQRAVARAISEFGRSPIDATHLSGRAGRTGAELVFRVPAQSESEFGVEVLVGEDLYTVYCDGWHEEFGWHDDNREDVHILLEKLTTLLDGRTKLRVKYAGRMPYRWELLHNYEDDKWESLGITGLFFYNYLGRRREVEKRNDKLQLLEAQP